MRIYKHYHFAKWMKKINLTDSALKDAIVEMEQGLIDADLGQCVFKKRIGVNGLGKSSSVRTVIAFRLEFRAIFIYGFAKNNKAALTNNEELNLKQLAKAYLGLDEQEMKIVVNIGELIEVI